MTAAKKKNTPARKVRVSDWRIVNAAVESALKGKTKSVRTELKLRGKIRPAWWNFVWECNPANERAHGDTRVYKSLVFRGNLLESKGTKSYLVIDAETLRDMRSAYRAR